MNPLPVLDPLPPPESVYDPQTDDLVSLIADEQAQLQSANNSIQAQQETLAGNVGGIGSAIDQIDGAITAIGTIFDALAAEQQAVDLSGIITDALAQDNALADSINNYNVDLGAIASALYGLINDALAALYNYLIDLLNYVLAGIYAAIDAVWAALNELWNLLSFF